MNELTIQRTWHSHGWEYTRAWLTPPPPGSALEDRRVIYVKSRDRYECYLNKKIIGIVSDFEKVCAFLDGEDFMLNDHPEWEEK